MLPPQLPAANQSRTDSTVTGIRPLTPGSGQGGTQAMQTIPVRTSFSETSGELGPVNSGETQQGTGWLGLSNPQQPGSSVGQRNPTGGGTAGGTTPAPWAAAQSSPTQLGAASTWQSATTSQGLTGSQGMTGGNFGVGGNQSLPPLSQPQFGQTGTTFNPSSGSLVPLAGGETLATGDRLLATDQVNRQRAAAAVTTRQSQVAGWDPGIVLPEFTTSAGLRQGRPVRPGQDAEAETLVSGSPVFQSPPIPASQTAGTTREAGGDDSADILTGSRSRADASMDQFSWWLMMCSVLANAILFYFLYDSRAKYLDLADELQARFFRER